MAALPLSHQRTVFAIFERHEKDADDWRRPHLGASKIGEECTRKLWYSFRWATREQFEGRMLRLFERGNREEAWLVEELRAIGVELHTEDPETKKQYRVSFHGGHFGGSADGVGLKFQEAAKTWHLLETKTSNDKGFHDLRSKGVKEAKPEHYAQMQTYMHGLGLTRAMYICVNKNTDEIYSERIHYAQDEAEAIVAKAGGVIFSPAPLTKISEDPSWWKCKFCFAHPICHMGETAKLERNCRTCADSTPNADGKWWCEFWKKTLTESEQREGCDKHLFIPALLPWEPESFLPEERAMVYRNGPDLVVDRAWRLVPMKFDPEASHIVLRESRDGVLFEGADDPAPKDH